MPKSESVMSSFLITKYQKQFEKIIQRAPEKNRIISLEVQLPNVFRKKVLFTEAIGPLWVIVQTTQRDGVNMADSWLCLLMSSSGCCVRSFAYFMGDCVNIHFSITNIQISHQAKANHKYCDKMKPSYMIHIELSSYYYFH